MIASTGLASGYAAAVSNTVELIRRSAADGTAHIHLAPQIWERAQGLLSLMRSLVTSDNFKIVDDLCRSGLFDSICSTMLADGATFVAYDDNSSSSKAYNRTWLVRHLGIELLRVCIISCF